MVYNSTVAYNLAEAGIEKAIFCLNETTNSNCGGNYGPNYSGESNISLAGGSFSTVVTGLGANRTIVSTGFTRIMTKKIKVSVESAPTSSGISFSYALQIGAGGAKLENNTAVYGSIYSNSDVICTSNDLSLITGDLTVSGSTGKIEKCKINYDAKAHNLEDSDIGRNAYYKTISSKTKVAGIKYPNSLDPELIALPALDLATWEASAEAGGIIEGDYTAANLSSLGPKKINGNLILSNNTNLTITGAIWITGNITINQGSILTLDPNFGENGTLIIADHINDLANYGKILISNGVTVESSSVKANILFVSTNNSTDIANAAIDLNNTAEGTIFAAPNGIIRLRNNADVKSLSAYALHLDNNAEVHYRESELVDLNFAAGPGGNWRLQKGTWQDLNL